MRRVMDDKHYVLGKMKEHFAEKRRELTRPGADAGSLIRRLDNIDKSWIKFQKAYEADALSVADLKARRVELNAERGRVERELERTRNRDAELDRLNADEAETRERVEAGYGSLDDATPEQQREIYEDIGLRVEVGLEKRPRISGFFPIGKMESERSTTIVVTSPEPLVAGFVGKEETSSRPSILPCPFPGLCACDISERRARPQAP